MKSYTPRSSVRYPQPDQAGFTLVEIMVGLVIGMLATMVVMQVFSVFENQKRSTTGAADALTNGNIALFKITRDAQAAGYSMVVVNTPPLTNSPYECTAFTISEPGFTDVFPVEIVNNVDGTTSDSITLRYGTTQMGGIPSRINSTGPITIASSFSCNTGDLTLVVNGTACTVSHATAVTPSAGAGSPGTVSLANSTNAVVGAKLACLQDWREVTYKVLPGNVLGFRDNLAVDPAAFTPLAAGVANIQVQYGIAASVTDKSVVAWVDPTGIWAAPAVADRNRIRAIRIAVVARDAKLDVDEVTSACNQAGNTGLCAWADIPGSPAPIVDVSGDADWKRYRYRVFETTVPLRNKIWN